MEGNNRLLGIELGLLEDMLRSIVRQEMTEMREEIKQTIISKRESLLCEERLYTEQVAEILNVKSRHTIYNYQKNGTLPEPQRDISGRPYWIPEQLESIFRLKGIKGKFPLN